MNELINKVKEWHHVRNLIAGSTNKDQFCKLIQECGELSDNLCKGNNVADDIGDIMVVLINIAEREGLCLEGCLATAYKDIEHRLGFVFDGVFIKREDMTSSQLYAIGYQHCEAGLPCDDYWGADYVTGYGDRYQWEANNG